MHICTKCGAKVGETSKFCPACGNPMQAPTARETQAAANSSGSVDLLYESKKFSRVRTLVSAIGIGIIAAVMGGMLLKANGLDLETKEELMITLFGLAILFVGALGVCAILGNLVSGMRMYPNYVDIKTMANLISTSRSVRLYYDKLDAVESNGNIVTIRYQGKNYRVFCGDAQDAVDRLNQQIEQLQQCR